MWSTHSYLPISNYDFAWATVMLLNPQNDRQHVHLRLIVLFNYVSVRPSESQDACRECRNFVENKVEPMCTETDCIPGRGQSSGQSSGQLIQKELTQCPGLHR